MLCDVVPMHASYLLLGRPWQFNRKAMRDGFMNRYSIVKDGKTITLVPLSPTQVYEYQMKLKKGKWSWGERKYKWGIWWEKTIRFGH